ncbi:MAG TPA: ABC transporter ATP-binding protein [Bryobacteraceae bacterium]|jgi:subfamily B ATP-binding cassette protein MsbA|nr:ABC transporter ATP-binding protein [Bryobacteraceae bacterium]
MPETSALPKLSATSNWRQMAQLLQPHWKAMSLALLAVLGETVTDLLDPWPLKIIVDNLLQSKPLPPWLAGIVSHLGQNKLAVLNFAVLAIAIIAIVGAISSYLEKYLTTSVGQWVMHDLRRTLYQHIHHLSLAEHDEKRTGDLISRVTSDIEAVQDFITSAMLGMLVNALTLAGMVAVMFYYNWRFALIALSIAPALFLVVWIFTKRIKKASRAMRQKEGELANIVQEVFTSIRVVKAFAREDYEQDRFEKQSLENVDTALQARSIKAKLSPMVEVLAAVGTCLVLGYGARLALAGQLSVGDLIIFLAYLNKMYKPMRDLSKMGDTVSKATVSYERIQEVLNSVSRVRDLPRARRAPPFKGKMEFDRVSFGYDPDRPILKEMSFQIEPGQVAAIVGPSGAGKSTIISLIPRFYDPTSGQVKIDGTDVRQYTLKSLREQMSFVLQDTVLFHVPIWQNIAYGKPDAQRAEIVRAAKQANAHEFIEKMPEGYDTMVGERGVSLSGGQRQRIAIARAVIRNTPILLLDEPTSGLDAESELAVFEALGRLMEGKTCIVIAHHLATIQKASVIFVIKDFQLAEHGTHEELLAAGGLYSELYRIQAAPPLDDDKAPGVTADSNP